MCGLIGVDGGDWFPVMILSRTAGEGNRTLVFSLEGYCSTIELHPQRMRARLPGGMTAGGVTGECRIRTCEGRSHQIYSLTPLTARETPLACMNGVRLAFVWWCVGDRGAVGMEAMRQERKRTRAAAETAALPDTGEQPASGITGLRIRRAELAAGVEPATC